MAVVYVVLHYVVIFTATIKGQSFSLDSIFELSEAMWSENWIDLNENTPLPSKLVNIVK